MGTKVILFVFQIYARTLKQHGVITGVGLVYVLYCHLYSKSRCFLVITFYITLKPPPSCHLFLTKTEPRQPGTIKNTAVSAMSKGYLKCLFVFYLRLPRSDLTDPVEKSHKCFLIEKHRHFLLTKSSSCLL